MSEQSREDRLRAELEGLKSLKRQSSIFDFEYEGDPPEMFTVTFSGKGIVGLANDEPEFTHSHQVQIQMAYLYPSREPDLKWLTPVFHPNVSNSGFVDMDDIGLVWSRELSVEIICERLWDVIRLAHLDLETSSQIEAKGWYKNRLNLKLPIDARPLRDRAVSTQSNVVQYSRRNPKQRKLEIAQQPEEDILFIDDEKQPNRVSASQSSSTQDSVPQRKNGDDDILFID